ncbi:MAG: hypothetical protein PWQ35_420 [Patescibacteria group bacterium]|nr:hypothetical protein [Patescibacteria group bacterium]
MASILLKHETEPILLMPIETQYLFDTKFQEVLSKTNFIEFENLFLNKFLPLSEISKNKFIILGLRPENKKEEAIVAKFASDFKKQITLWIDDASWKPDFYNYLRLENQNIIASSDSSCLSKLKTRGYPAPTIWLHADEALQKIDLRNQIARRYAQAMIVNQVIVNNYQNNIESEIRIFELAVKEIIDQQENFEISMLADMFIEMVAQTSILKDKFSDTHPIFRKAKKIGRPVGYLYLKNMKCNTDIKSIIKLGLEKFPWLCVVIFKLNDKKYIHAKSKFIPINDLLNSYGELEINANETLKLLSAEVVNYKIKNN